MTILGIDPSYTRTGISIIKDNKIQVIKSLKFKGLKKKVEKRIHLAKRLKKYIDKYSPDMVIVERVRQFSTNDKTKFFAMNMIKTGVSLLTTIVDTAYEAQISVFSVDTRSWKSQVVGTSKADKTSKKQPTIDYVKSLGYEVYDDDDAADACCIALFYWSAEKKSGSKRRDELLRLEE